MGRPHWHPSSCRWCGKRGSDADPISQTGKCGDCARVILLDNIEQMHTRSGPNFAKWRRAMAACVGGILLDDVNGEH